MLILKLNLPHTKCIKKILTIQLRSLSSNAERFRQKTQRIPRWKFDNIQDLDTVNQHAYMH